MRQPTTQFPVLSQSYAGALEANPVHLNGQKVLFDKPVTLLPTELKKRDTQDD
jgi:hypothetical protein